jgi:hypothetical protein
MNHRGGEYSNQALYSAGLNSQKTEVDVVEELDAE